MEAPMPEVLIIPNKYEDRSTTSAQAMSFLVKSYSEYLISDFAIRKSEDFLRSAREQLPISFFCKANSMAFEDVRDYLRILINKSAITQ
jgi:hypothetical protein